MALAVRLTGRAGEPIAARPTVLPPAPPARRRSGTAPSPRGIARDDAFARGRPGRRGAAEGQARMDLATALGEKLSEDTGEHAPSREARRAADLLPADVEAQLLAARLEDQDPNRRREHLEAALRADPGNPVARLALAEEEIRRGRAQEAVRQMEPIAAGWPGWAAARGSLAQAWEQVGLSVPRAGRAPPAGRGDARPARHGRGSRPGCAAARPDRGRHALVPQGPGAAPRRRAGSRRAHHPASRARRRRRRPRAPRRRHPARARGSLPPAAARRPARRQRTPRARPRPTTRPPRACRPTSRRCTSGAGGNSCGRGAAARRSPTCSGRSSCSPRARS